ncbi:Protein of unknown function [Quadrisphaera granulorum]|uniref:DUF3071 domain-containing protein n=1 Tax=Quadrisphaera granulorum TaxID=317664 RepID=A0A315ZUM0_9ACTN|nr:septation protein SepH [Quadrisphaera granulorum]PWJ49281.1 Protein of unknown function (DUF3071) [Quadrisphaera granulorum]SZE98198.1 Protein of unknown function [Quadrisphaera granulorum]
MRDGLEEAPQGVDGAAAGGGKTAVELSVVGTDPADPSVVLLEGPDGSRYRLPVGPSLKAALRSAGPAAASALPPSGPLRPRDIQARIRAGETAEDVAADAGMPLEQVQRYEGPVLAERAHIAELARTAVVRGGPAKLTLEDAVRTRLLARGADPGTTAWDAWRRDGGWAVQASFRAAGRDRSAQWSFTPSNRALEPLDDEARWLTAPSDDPTGRRLAAVRVFDVEAEDSLADAHHDPRSDPRSDPRQGPAVPAGEVAPRQPVSPSPVAPTAPTPPATSGVEILPNLDTELVAPASGPAAHHASAGHAPVEAAGSAASAGESPDDADPAPSDDLASRTLDLLDALRDRRGRRVPLDLGPDGEPWDEEEDDDDLLNALLDLPPGAQPDTRELQEEVDRARARLRMVTPPRGIQLPPAGASDTPEDEDDDEGAQHPSPPRASLGLVPAPPPTGQQRQTPAPPSAGERLLPRPSSEDLPRREPVSRRDRRWSGDAEPSSSATATSTSPSSGSPSSASSSRVEPPAPSAPASPRSPDAARPASPSVSVPTGIDDPEHDGDDPAEQPARRRRSVPSWDEIVFGAPRRD